MKFTIGFEKEDTNKLHLYWDEIIDKHKSLEDYFSKIIKEKLSVCNNV